MPTERFPLPFVGYVRLKGVGADQTDRFDETSAANTLGKTLGALHATPADTLSELDLPTRKDPPSAWPDRLLRRADRCRALLTDDLCGPAEPYLLGQATPPAAPTTPPLLLYNDSGPDHLLTDPTSSRLAGLIDFADAAFGDPPPTSSASGRGAAPRPPTRCSGGTTARPSTPASETVCGRCPATAPCGDSGMRPGKAIRRRPSINTATRSAAPPSTGNDRKHPEQPA